MNNKNLHCIIFGKVQGVGFRNWVKKKASENSFCGWVKHCSDVSVELEVSGELEKLTKFLDDIDSGPTLLKITNKSFEFLKYKFFKDFNIL